MRTIKELNDMELINFQENELEFIDIVWGKDKEGNKVGAYLVKKYIEVMDSGFSKVILTENEVEYIIEKQEKLKKQVKDKAERKRKRRAEQEKTEKNYKDLKGFADSKSKMQLGRIRKTLNKEYIYKRYNRTMTRKDYIIALIKDGYNTLENREGERALVNGDVWLLQSDFTKTEFDFAEYLIKNNLINC